MGDVEPHPALARLLRDPDCAIVLRTLGGELSGADATTLLLAALEQRARALEPSGVLEQYQHDRFVAPATVDPVQISRLAYQALEALQIDGFTPIENAPVAPLGAHSVFAGVHQNNVVSTIRMSEAAADPTNQLALEAAVRRNHLLRADPRSRETVRLCAVERVLRAQLFDGPRSFAHFSLLGLVVSGRDVGGHRFESASMIEIIGSLADFVMSAVPGDVLIDLSDFDGRFGDVVDDVIASVRSERVRCRSVPSRTSGRGYYPNACFKLSVETGGEVVEIGDGGAVDWTATLLGNRKERLVIGGLSLERLCTLQLTDPGAG